MPKGIRGFQKGNKLGYKPCKEELKIRFSKERSGKNNPNWKGSIIKSKCIKCQEEVKDYRVRKYCSCKCANTCKIRLKFLSEAHAGKIGELASNWQGGSWKQSNLRSLKKYWWWRNKIYQLKGRECENCNSKNNLEIDHIKPLAIILAENNIKTVKGFLENPKVWELKNGRVLCKKCHKLKQISWKGIKNFKKVISLVKNTICTS